MTQTIPEASLMFSFPDNWRILKFDETRFHKERWNSFAKGSKAVDFVAAFDGVVWFIEVKDYRANPRQKPSEVFDEVAMKVRDTLAGLKVLSVRDSDSQERDDARHILANSKRFRVVLHLEQPKQTSKLFPQTIDWKNARDQLRRVMRTMDPHSLVGDQTRLNGLVAWSVA